MPNRLGHIAAPGSREPLLSPVVRWFMLAMVLANVSSAMYGLLLPLYLTELGATVGQVGLVFSLTSVAILGLQILGGWVSDSIGRLKAIAFGSLGGVVGIAAMFLAPSWQWMILALAVNQVPYALVAPSFSAFLAENSTEENRGKVYGLADTIFQVTGLVGPPLGGFLAGRYGFRPMLAVAAVLYWTAAALRIWMAATMSSAGEREPQALSVGSLKVSLRTMFAMMLGGGVITWIFLTDGVRDIAFRLSGELMPIYIEEIGGVGVQKIGLLGSVLSAAMMISPLASGRLTDRYGEHVPISAGFALASFSFLVFLRAESFLAFAACWALFGIGMGLLSPAYQSLISKVVPQERLGVFTGVFRSSLGFISLPAPLIGAQLWERFDPRVPFAITAVVSMVAVVPTWLKFRVPDSELNADR